MQLTRTEEVLVALEQMHEDVAAKASLNRKKVIATHNRKTGPYSLFLNLNIGDFVIIRRAFNTGYQLNFKWVGPRRISGISSELVYEVTNLDGSKSENNPNSSKNNISSL